MKYLIRTILLTALVALSSFASAALAQQPELVTEIVARVNNDIVTRADYLNALRDFHERIKEEMKGKSEAEIQAEFEKLKANLLNYIIDDMLLEQKAKEMGADVEAQVNEEMLRIANEQGVKNVLEFEKALQQQGIDPSAARNQIRKQLLQSFVFNKEVLRPIYENLTEKDKRDYYEKHKDSFKTPATATLSEIFLSLDNQTAAEVEQRAKRIVAELRAGKNFVEAVQQYSSASSPSRALNGRLGQFTLADGELRPDLFAAVKDLKVGEVTEPIRQQNGYQIIHIDERKDETLVPFSDPRVQQFVNQNVTMERADEARKKYLKKLRADAFIEINPSYDPSKNKVADNKGE